MEQKEISKYTQSFDSSEQAKQTPLKFWRFFDEEDFDSSNNIIISSGNFGTVKRTTFKSFQHFEAKGIFTPYAGQVVALKEPKTNSKNSWIQDQYNLSHEVSCTVILHPHLINYIGGLDLSHPQRIAIIMELMEIDLRTAIEKDRRFKDVKIQLKIAKQIASGMNFLHSLKPCVLHRDLRTPNILVDSNLDCKIGDFGISVNLGYEGMNLATMYTQLIPPECTDQKNFTPKGDVYFYGWVLVELATGNRLDNYNISEAISFVERTLKAKNKINQEYKYLISTSLARDCNKRLDFQTILGRLSSLLEIKYDLELISQKNLMDLLNEGIKKKEITLNKCDSFGRNLAFQCCIFGSTEMLNFLVQKWGKQILLQKDRYQISLTHLAARSGYLSILKLLESYNCLISEPETRFQTRPIDLAIAMKHNDCIDFLIPRIDQQTLDGALMSATSEGNLELVKKLFLQGASLDFRDAENGAGILDRAAYDGHFEIAKFLLEKGALVNQARPDNATPLWNAAQNGHTEIVKLLISYGADVNVTTNDTKTPPLFMACQNGHKDVVELLLKNKANPNSGEIGEVDCSPLFIACQCGHKEIVKLLIEYKANVDFSCSDDGTTPLFAACRENHLEIVELLLQNGANVNHTRTDNLATSLMIACYKGYFRVAQSLIRYGADPNLVMVNGTSLYFACKLGTSNLEIAQMLLENKANPNLILNNGDSCLIAAVEQDNLELVKLLVKYGANVHHKRNNKTALDRTQNEEVIKYLTSVMAIQQ